MLKVWGSMGAVDVDTIQEQHMDMNIRVQCTAKALDQRNCASLCGGFGVTGFADQVETSRRIS